MSHSLSSRTRLIVLVSVAVLAGTVVSRFTTANSHADFIGNLTASVGPGFEIQLKTAEGALVTQLAAGTYGIHVNDNASNHNFHLEGPGVNMATGIADIQVADWTVDFGDSYYTYHCDMHPSLTATFASGNVPALPAPAPVTVAPATQLTPVTPVSTSSSSSGGSSSSSSGSIAVPSVIRISGTIKITLTDKDKLVVTKNGKAVTGLDTGTYNLAISDKSRKNDLMLRRAGGSAKQLSGRSFVGTKSLTLELYGGTWKLYAAGSEKTIFSLIKVND